ncbi:WSSV120 [White spot syndrome virus]|uniref:WSSV120 n=1 Tax=White spot syndrome virus TaxID=342409 RepID=A0A2I6SBM7_9VIRU|nr:WSSV120 [White spot syndrome virus]
MEEEEEEVEGRRDKVGLFIVSRKVFTFFVGRAFQLKEGRSSPFQLMPSG